ncbi:MAG TPA: hypothetical protein VD816_17835 [Ohtaekwangia sp.]|nr:hypothetical protein [Ohtaekwangia sp.]
MNLILGSIILFILISPGLIFRYAYLQGTYAKQTFKISAVDEIFWAIIPAFIFQLSGILITNHFTSLEVRLDQVYHVITSAHADIDFDVIVKSLPGFLLYILILIVIAASLGFTARYFVRKFQLDLRYPFLKVNNEWYYLFSGEILDFLDTPGESKQVEMIQVDVIVNTGEGTMVYSGTLENYFLSKDNGLDRIYLSNVYRRKMKDDLDPAKPNVGYLERYLDERYYAMPGDLFVITYDKIININITYHGWSNILTDDAGLL